MRKHGVRFSDAESVLFDPDGVTIEDPVAESQQRFVTIGLDSIGRFLVVVYGYENDTIRLISARRASPGEIRRHEKRV